MISSLRKWLRLNPLARYALAAIAGIIIVDYGLISASNYTEILMALGCGCLLFIFCGLSIPGEIPVLILFIWLHQGRIAETSSHPLRACLEGNSLVEALVIAYLTPFPPTGTAGDGGRQQLTLETTSIQLRQNGIRLSAPALLRGWMTSHEPLPEAGVYEVTGRLRISSGPTNPGEFDGTAYALRQGIVAEMDVRNVRLLERDRFPIKTRMLNWAESCREWVSLQLERGIENETENLSLIRGMALGAIDESSAEIERPFRDTGTLHVFAVSGLHVGLFSGIGWAFLRLLGVRRSIALLILMPGVFAYAFITGWRPSAARAAIMVAILMAATLFDRQSRIQNSMGAAALILLAGDTHLLFLAGFQLSFGVLWAIALLAAPVITCLRPWTALDPFLPPQLANWRQQVSSNVRTSVASSFAVSAAAWLGSLPLMLWHFNVVTPVAIVANCVLVPAAFLVLAAATASLVLAALHLGWAQIATNWLNAIFAKLMLGSAVLFAKVPGATITTSTTDISLRPPVELTVLHLPYGEAAQHLRLNQTHWLLDTGTKKSFTRIVEPLLRIQACSRFEGIILSHSDIAHVGGALNAHRDYDHAPLYLSVHEPWPLESSLSSLKQFLAAGSPGVMKLAHLSEGDVINLAPNAAATVLYPTVKGRHDKGDDRALVLLLVIDGFRILWCNDAGFLAEKQIMERHLLKSIRCDVLIRNQHATDYSALSEFLSAASPRIIITSNVPYLDEQVMPATLTEYALKKGVLLFDQDVHGAVSLAIQNDLLIAKGFTTGHTTVLHKRER